MSFWQKPCTYCGDPITTIGLDRIDSKLGYVMGNVCSCCAPCNRAKLAMSTKQYVEMCGKVVANYIKKNRAAATN